jgi:hypothetical protein
MASIARLIAVALIFAPSESEAARAAASGGGGSGGASLLEIASKLLSGLTRAERALLEFTDQSNIIRSEFAITGTSTRPLNPSNDPKHADQWPHASDIRAELFRWLAIYEMRLREVADMKESIYGAAN